MTSVACIPLGELMATKTGTVDPTKYQDEVFDLYSIPAFDRGVPEVADGSAIGSAKQVVEPQDVLLSKIVPHIRRAWVVGEDRGRRLIASGEWIVFRSRRAEPGYLRQVLRSDSFHVQFMQTVAGVGGSLLRARPAQVARIPIPLPPLPEQRRIAAILDQADALRAKRREVLAQLDSLTQSIFIEMFGAAANDQLGWPKLNLAEAADVLTGYAFKSDEFVDMGSSTARLCRGTNVMPGRVDWQDLACWPKTGIETLSSFVLKAGDIVMAMDRPWISEGFKIARIAQSDCPALLVQRVARVRARANALNDFLYGLLLQPAFAQHCRPTETTIPHISPKEIRSFELRLPPLALQETFATRIRAVEALKATHRAALAELDALFVSLQHRAFSGNL